MISLHLDGDVYGQLQQKERDLILAAELGKALLEKNEELSKQNEKIAEDFSAKLEVTSSNIVYLHKMWLLQDPSVTAVNKCVVCY